MVALYNNFYNQNLAFRHSTEVTEIETLNLLFENFEQTLYTLIHTIDRTDGDSLPDSLTKIIKNLKRFVNNYITEFNACMERIVEIVKDLSDECLENNFLNTFFKFSSTWRDLFNNSKENNSLAVFRNLVNGILFQNMLFDCITTVSISPPQKKIYNIEMSEIGFDIIKFYDCILL